MYMYVYMYMYMDVVCTCRDVLAHDSLLDLPERVDWRDCKLPKQKETEITQAFRQTFQPFDFTLADDDD